MRTPASDVIAGLTHLDGAMLPILHALQESFGYVDAAAIPLVAEGLECVPCGGSWRDQLLPRFSVGAGRHACAEALPGGGLPGHGRRGAGAAPVERGTDCKLGDTTPDGRLTVEGVYCLGNCAVSPAALLDDALIGQLDRGALDAIVQRSGEPRQ
jgi:formate dehydrogenase subunit gamma